MITCIECKIKPTTSLGSRVGYCHHTHYAISKLESIEDIRNFFPEGKADGMNWLVASTSGIHGSYTTLGEIEMAWGITDVENEKYCGRNITVEIIMPRMVRLIYGDIELKSKDDIKFLRKLIKSSLKEIKKTQKSNI